MIMVKLPKGVTVRIGGHEFVGEIPEAACPEVFKSKSIPKPIKK